MRTLFASLNATVATDEAEVISTNAETAIATAPFVFNREFFAEVSEAHAVIDQASERHLMRVIRPIESAKELMYRGLDVFALAQRIAEGGQIDLHDVQEHVLFGDVTWLNDRLSSDLPNEHLCTGLSHYMPEAKVA